jgi:hypothetical protein
MAFTTAVPDQRLALEFGHAAAFTDDFRHPRVGRPPGPGVRFPNLAWLTRSDPPMPLTRLSTASV